MFNSIRNIQQSLSNAPWWIRSVAIGMCLCCIYVSGGCDSNSSDPIEPANAPASQPAASDNLPPGPVVVSPGEDLQHALDQAMATVSRKLVLKPGVYQSPTQQFCLLALTARHDGVTVEGMDGAILSGQSLFKPDTASVSHVLYCGNGVSSATTIRNLTITGAKGLATRTNIPKEDFGDRAQQLQQGLFFVMDGGAAKMFGECSPVFQNIEFIDNETALCGGAVSIEQQGFRNQPVTFQNCRFLRNRCPATGSAVDVLQNSSVKLDNCLFVDNIANYGMTEIKRKFQLEYNSQHGCGALTVFPGATAVVTRCTFHQNWNAVDDKGTGSRYKNTIFADNDASDGSRDGHPYEMDIINANGVTGCLFYADHPDLQGNISGESNRLDAPDPKFDNAYVPTAIEFADVGYRPNR